jgi:uncharacterized protein YqhQ
MAMQRLTTTEPDDSQIEVAIAAMSEVLRQEPESPGESGQQNGPKAQNETRQQNMPEA